MAADSHLLVLREQTSRDYNQDSQRLKELWQVHQSQ